MNFKKASGCDHERKFSVFTNISEIVTGEPECAHKIRLITETPMMTVNVQTDARVVEKNSPSETEESGVIYPGSWCLRGRG